MSQINCTIQPQMFDASSIHFIMPGGTIAEMLGEARDVEGLGVYLEDHEVAREYWHLVTPKDGTHLTVHVPVHGGGKKKGGGKNPLAVIASLVVVAGAIAISGPLGAGVLGPSFAAGTTGASLAGAAVGLPGSVAMAPLLPAEPQTVANATVSEIPKQDTRTGADSNQAELSERSDGSIIRMAA